MPANHYRFVADWVVPAPREAVWPLLADATTYPKWWPAVYLSAEVEAGPQGVAPRRRTRFHTKGASPYHLYWTAVITEVREPELLALRAHGDFEGWGRWTLAPHPVGTPATLEWDINADKPLLRWLSPVARPLFAWNHRWAMARGAEGLRAYLAPAA